MNLDPNFIIACSVIGGYALIGLIVATAVYAFTGEDDGEGPMMMGLFWPLTVGFFCIAGPIFAFYFIARWAGLGLNRLVKRGFK